MVGSKVKKELVTKLKVIRCQPKLAKAGMVTCSH